MNLAEIESSVHEAIDAGDPDTLDYYAEHVAEIQAKKAARAQGLTIWAVVDVQPDTE